MVTAHPQVMPAAGPVGGWASRWSAQHPGWQIRWARPIPGCPS